MSNKRAGFPTENDTFSIDSSGIQELCLHVADSIRTIADCPRCSSCLLIKASIQQIEVKCPSGCFRFDCECVGLNGRWLTGVLDFPGNQKLNESRSLALDGIGTIGSI
jgi:hypothetical protein